MAQYKTYKKKISQPSLSFRAIYHPKILELIHGTKMQFLALLITNIAPKYMLAK